MSHPDSTTNRHFGKLTPVFEVLEWVKAEAKLLLDRIGDEAIPIAGAVGRVLADDLVAETNLPPFRRAMMDGIAIQQEQSTDRQFVIAETGSDSIHNLPANTGLPVQTGSPLIGDWDTVIPIEALLSSDLESTSTLSSGEVVTLRSDATFPIGSNIAEIGEDFCQGQFVFAAGRRLRIQDTAVMAALGMDYVAAKRIPHVEILVTGDELSSNSASGNYRIHDANGPVLQQFVARDGSNAFSYSSLEDDSAKIASVLNESNADILLISGGTSVGPRDYIADIVAKVGVLQFHGINMRPGKPMGVGKLGGKTVFLLPGNPVACQFGYELIARPFIQIASGRTAAWPYVKLLGKLTEDVLSKSGRVDYLRVKISKGTVHPLTSGRASNLSSVTDADGFVIVPAETDQLMAGEAVTVYRFDG